MRVGALLSCLLFVGGCSNFRDATPADAGSGDGALDAPYVPMDEGGTSFEAGDGAVRVTVQPMVTGRSRVGARSSAGYPYWRSGIAVHNDQVYWVEGGAQPGVYTAPASCSATSCVQQVASISRPSAFTATSTALFVADVTVLLRVPYAGGSGAKFASSTTDIVNLASDGSSAFWTEGTDQNIRKTDAAGTTNTMIYSNGTPVAMAVAGNRVFWVGVDISGQLGAIQVIGTDGAGAREVSRFSAGFSTMQGSATYLYYAKDSPGTIHRITLGTNHDESVASDATNVNDFAIDDTHAYWVEAGDAPDYLNGRLRRIAHDAQTAETLAVSIAHPVGVAVSGRTVFVLSGGTKAAAYADGAILRVTISP